MQPSWEVLYVDKERKKIMCDEKQDWAFDIYSATCGAKTLDGVFTFNLVMVISRWRIRYGSCCSNLTLSTGQVPVIVLLLNTVIVPFFCSCRACL